MGGERKTATLTPEAIILSWKPLELREKLEALKKDLDWPNTTGVAREWWEAFENQNKSNLATVYVLTEYLQARQATITEFFLAYVYSCFGPVENGVGSSERSDSQMRQALEIGH